MSDGSKIAALTWSLALVTRAFRDLTAGFAAIDVDAADRAIENIEAMVAAELTAFSEKPPEGIVVNKRDFIAVVGPLREMTQGARAMIQQAGKPKH
jgi:hypothetical protein